MNFSFSEIFSYWDILKEYINPVPILWWGILGAVGGFTVMVILLITFRKKVLINRRHRILKTLAYAYLLLLPLWAGYNAMQWFALHGCERQIVKNIPTYLGNTNSLFNLYAKEYITGIISERYLQLSSHEILDKTVGYTAKIVANTIKANPTEEKGLKVKVSTFITAKFIESDMAKNIILNEVEKRIGEPLLMDRKLTRQLLDVKIQNLLDDGILNKVVTKHVEKLFDGFKSNVLVLFLLILIIPLAEITIAYYLERKRTANQTPTLPTET